MDTCLRSVVAADALRPLLDATEAAALRLGLAPSHALKVRLVVEELYTNLLAHPPPPPALPAAQVCVQLRAEDGAAVLRFVDDAPAFDPLAFPLPATPPERVGGLGILLVRGLARAGGYQRLDARNVLSLTVPA
jgi:anti-sigma regulatory factor (Ser/Thr protein kinase)